MQLYPVRIPLRNAIIGYAILCAVLAVIVGNVVFWTSELVTAVYN
jgi:hypothetical protein